MSLVQHPEAAHGHRQAQEGQRLTAPEIQDIKGGELLPGLGPLLLFCRADRRKQQPVLVQPLEAALLAQIRQLPDPALLIEPQALLVAVVFLIRRGHHEGGPLPIRGEAEVGEEAIVEDIGQGNRFHMFFSLTAG